MGKRVVRFKDASAPAVKKKTRTVEQLLQELQISRSETVEGLSEGEVEALIDRGTESNELQKEIATEVKLIKMALLEKAHADKWRMKSGSVGVAKVSRRTSTSILPKKMVALLAKLKKQKLFDALFTVKVGEVKKYLGSDVIEPIATIETNPFGSISFKKLKK